MPDVPPLRVAIAILVLVVAAAGLIFALLRALRRRRHPRHGIHIDLVSGGAERTEPPRGG